MINSSSGAFNIYPSNFVINLGDFNQKISIGADRDIM
jgi:hypothetical protein